MKLALADATGGNCRQPSVIILKLTLTCASVSSISAVYASKKISMYTEKIKLGPCSKMTHFFEV